MLFERHLPPREKTPTAVYLLPSFSLSCSSLPPFLLPSFPSLCFIMATYKSTVITFMMKVMYFHYRKYQTSVTRGKHSLTIQGLLLCIPPASFSVVYITCCLVAQSCPTFATPQTVARQAPLSLGFSRQEHWSGLPVLLQGVSPPPCVSCIGERTLYHRVPWETVHVI